MDLLREFEKEQISRIERPRLAAGDIVRVEMKITEGEKTRLQVFEGTVIGVRGSGPSVTFTVRREVGDHAIERIFPLYNPLITNIEITKRQKVRRAKLGYLRQEGRRRVKEDKKAMTRYIEEEKTKVRLAEAKAEKEAKAQEKEAADKEKLKAAKTETSADDAPKEEKPKASDGQGKKDTDKK